MRRILYVLLLLTFPYMSNAGEPIQSVMRGTSGPGDPPVLAMADHTMSTDAIVALETAMAEDQTKERIQKAVQYYLGTAKGHPMYQRARQQSFVDDLYTAGTEEGLPETLLPTIAYLESSFRSDAVGKLGEVGLVQVHGEAKNGCDLETQLGQLRCGAKWLRKAYDACGNWRGAMTMYATGKCATKKERIKRMISYRMRLWETVENL